MTIHTDTINEYAYDGDFYDWTIKTSKLLREGHIGEVDLEQVAEEIEDMGKSDKRALSSYLKLLMVHLLKWHYQPKYRGISWKLSITNARDEIQDLLKDSPSLNSKVEQLITDRYATARKRASLETGLVLDSFPNACPFSVEQLLDDDYWPD
ncbi:DUF29 domain-containing protein [Candidatus Thiosymbion oneisti]|uniref:DUF29 domain-containing protein n=1 Tax=Candidatus Thiosymbion oneisti TaxID=589554 RepID=UPI00105C1131|nr:DUF29 domain-containing protein [Candidatus Thiosymbion oneisti]